MSSRVRSILKHVAIVLAGNTLYALAVVCFILPSGMISGGSTGLALAAQHWWGIDVADFVLVLNLLLFAVGWLLLGKKLALSTALSTFYYPLALRFFQKLDFLQNWTSDRMLATVCAGLMLGLALGLVLGAGSSTGGLDIPPLVLNKYFGLSVSLVLNVVDVLILLLQAFFRDRELVLYGVLMVMIYTLVLDRVMLAGRSRIQVKIVSEKSPVIRGQILHQLDRGVTLLHGQTGYTSQPCDVLMTVVTHREMARLNQLVLDADPHAFIVVNQVNEVRGRGFTLERLYK